VWLGVRDWVVGVYLPSKRRMGTMRVYGIRRRRKNLAVGELAWYN